MGSAKPKKSTVKTIREPKRAPDNPIKKKTKKTKKVSKNVKKPKKVKSPSKQIKKKTKSTKKPNEKQKKKTAQTKKKQPKINGMTVIMSNLTFGSKQKGSLMKISFGKSKKIFAGIKLNGFLVIDMFHVQEEHEKLSLLERKEKGLFLGSKLIISCTNNDIVTIDYVYVENGHVEMAFMNHF